MSAPCPQDFIACAHSLADAARPILQRYFRTRLDIDDKADDSPVTIADREAEKAMRAIITETFPDHGILGEEWGPERVDARYVWVLDPIDGTKAFITGIPVFGTLIALCENGIPILGIIDQPISGERWLGARGHATTLNGAPQAVRPCAALAEAYCYATAPEMFDGGNETAWARIRGSVKNARHGADCYAYGLLASGFVDVIVEASLQPYDFCAHVPIIEGAGGIITDWDGKALGLASGPRVVAAGDKRVHQQALASLARETTSP